MAATKTKTAKAKTSAKTKTAAKAKTTKVAAKATKTVAKAKTTKAAAKSKAPAKAKAAKPKAAAKTAKKAVKNVKTFDAPKFQEFTIRDNAGVVGQVRVKPNAVAWKSKSSKAYHQISIDQLAALTAEHGRQVKA